jgi:hypothetical protein
MVGNPGPEVQARVGPSWDNAAEQQEEREVAMLDDSFGELLMASCSKIKYPCMLNVTWMQFNFKDQTLDLRLDGYLLQESHIDALLKEENIDLLVLARYMQIFSPDFCSRHASRTINIHHSFLPAFEGTPGVLHETPHRMS